MKINNVEIPYKTNMTTDSEDTAITGNSGIAESGNFGTAISHYAGHSITNHFGMSITMTNGIAETGYEGIAISGIYGKAKAGKNGSIIIKYWDGARTRWAIGYVGEDGIKENTFYKVEDGKLVECKENERNN